MVERGRERGRNLCLNLYFHSLLAEIHFHTHTHTHTASDAGASEDDMLCLKGERERERMHGEVKNKEVKAADKRVCVNLYWMCVCVAKNFTEPLKITPGVCVCVYIYSDVGHFVR